MKIVVCIKQVPDTTEVKIDPITNTLIRSGVPSIVNPFDKNAVEEALRLKEIHDGSVIAISMGPPQTSQALKECLAMGVDEAILISDRDFGGADTLATSYTLSKAIEKIGSVDIIICGKQAIDGDTAQVGPEIAEHLKINQLTYVSKFSVENNKVLAKREHEDGYVMVESSLPILVSVVKSINEPRFATVKNTLRANRTTIPVWSSEDLKTDKNRIGLIGSPTKVDRIFSPDKRKQGIMIVEETYKDSVLKLKSLLSEAKIL